MKAFRERLSTYDDGFYQPTMINGNLDFVRSEGSAVTARDSGSARCEFPLFIFYLIEFQLHVVLVALTQVVVDLLLCLLL